PSLLPRRLSSRCFWIVSFITPPLRLALACVGTWVADLSLLLRRLEIRPPRRAPLLPEQEEREQEERQHGRVGGGVDFSFAAQGEAEPDEEADDRERGRGDRRVGPVANEGEYAYEQHGSDDCLGGSGGGRVERLCVSAQDAAEVQRRDDRERERFDAHEGGD